MKQLIWAKLIPIQPQASAGYTLKGVQYKEKLESYFPNLPKLTNYMKDRFAINLHFNLNSSRGHDSKGDLDNFIKLITDACTGHFWKDDKQVDEIKAIINRYSAQNSVNIAIYHFITELGRKGKSHQGD